MTNPNKVKGDKAERGAAALIHYLTGWPARRQLGAGRADDVGDIDGIPDSIIQVAAWQDVARALRVKPVEAEQQRQNANATHAATFLRLRGGDWRVVMTVEQWACYAREALS